MMKEESGVSNTQAWGCPHAPQETFKETQASKLGEAPVHPLLHQQLSVRPSFHYIFITSCVMCYAWIVVLFSFPFQFYLALFAVHKSQNPALFVRERIMLHFKLEHIIGFSCLSFFCCVFFIF